MEKNEKAEKADKSERLSMVSKTTKNTIISSLQCQLDEERQARMKLEAELMSLKKISLEIQESIKSQS